MSYSVLHTEDSGVTVYKKTDADGVFRVSCFKHHPPFQEWLRKNKDNLPSDIQAKVDDGSLKIEDAD
tara:strand:+ start:922 stop:1122 length:201 start_codon:yes stop_codon:yes gene_type:complete